MSIKKYVNGAWSEVGYKKYGTETDTITTLPKTIIGDGTAISAYTIKGNMAQSGTPTPTNPIYPQECGDKTANLFPLPTTPTSGYISGISYVVNGNGIVNLSGTAITNVNIDIPIINSFTVPLSVGAGGSGIFCINNSFVGNVIIRLYNNTTKVDDWVCSTINRMSTGYLAMGNKTIDRYAVVIEAGTTIPEGSYLGLALSNDGIAVSPYEPYGYKIPISLGNYAYPIYISEPLRKSLDGSNVYDTIESNGVLTRRVDANGDALATPTTEQITVPTLPTTGTAEQFDVDTTLKPSEVQLTYHGWHEHSDTMFTE